VPRAGLDPEAVVSAAAELADAEGLEAVTLAKVAARLNVRAPSLYVHVGGGLEDLRQRIAGRGARALAGQLQAVAAGRAGEDALRAIADVYRAYARAHPGSYAAMQRPTGFSREETAPTMIVDVLLAVIRGYGLRDDDAVHAVRVVRSALHGFVLLETGEGFGLPLDLDDTFARLVQTLHRGIAA
jgi:AcrR family transcriptional regulator